MRLICPNCSAQYEVGESVIPEAGRDVQCSQCGNTWWQLRAPVEAGADAAGDSGSDRQAGAAQAEEAASTAAARSAADGAGDSEPSAGENAGTGAARDTDDAPGTGAEASDGTDTEGGDSGDADSASPVEEADDVASDAASREESPDSPAPPGAPARRPALDEAVMAMLRQEAEREAAQRQIEGGGVESQGEFGLGGTGAGAHGAGRSARLPNIDDINSTLSGPVAAGGAGAPAAAMHRQKRMRGFRLGFSLMLFVATGIIVLYLQAERLAVAAPSLAPSIESFVANVDAGRRWLDRAALQATESIREMTDRE